MSKLIFRNAVIENQLQCFATNEQIIQKKDNIIILSELIETDFILLFNRLNYELCSKCLLKDMVLADLRFGLLFYYPELIDKAFNLIKFINRNVNICNKKEILLAFVEILKFDFSFSNKVIEEIEFLKIKNELENWEFANKILKEIQLINKGK